MAAKRFSGASDQELMRLIQADDVDAFDALYDRLAPRALRVAGALCADRDRVLEAVQDGFLSLWRSRASYHPERGQVHAWVSGIVRNRAIDSNRRNRRRDQQRARDETLIDDLPATGDLETEAIEHALAGELHALLGDLPQAQREVIALAFFGELTHAEIAEHLALPLGTVKGRMRLGLMRLRDKLTADAA